jgi:hypothetical protein
VDTATTFGHRWRHVDVAPSQSSISRSMVWYRFGHPCFKCNDPDRPTPIQWSRTGW